MFLPTFPNLQVKGPCCKRKYYCPRYLAPVTEVEEVAVAVVPAQVAAAPEVPAAVEELYNVLHKYNHSGTELSSP